MTRPVPLMYVRKVPVAFEEESTSIFIKEEMDQEGILAVRPDVLEQLAKTQTPFGKHLYNPITIVIENGEMYTGSIEQVDDEIAVIKLEDTEQLQSIPLIQIMNMIWRGKTLLA